MIAQSDRSSVRGHSCWCSLSPSGCRPARRPCRGAGLTQLAEECAKTWTRCMKHARVIASPQARQTVQYKHMELFITYVCADTCVCLFVIGQRSIEHLTVVGGCSSFVTFCCGSYSPRVTVLRRDRTIPLWWYSWNCRAVHSPTLKQAKLLVEEAAGECRTGPSDRSLWDVLKMGFFIYR